MDSSESVTEWLDQLKQGDPLAAEKLWGRYISQLVREAHKKLGQTRRRAADEEDVALAAFASFCKGVEAGRFPKLDDRDDLWQVLLILTQRKAIDQIRQEHAQMRGGGDVRGESVLDAGGPGSSSPPGMARIADAGPTPEFAALVAEQLERLLGALQDRQLREIALDKMAGNTNEEIAQRLGISLRSVERKLQLIRRIWRQEHEQ